MAKNSWYEKYPGVDLTRSPEEVSLEALIGQTMKGRPTAKAKIGPAPEEGSTEDFLDRFEKMEKLRKIHPREMTEPERAFVEREAPGLALETTLAAADPLGEALYRGAKGAGAPEWASVGASMMAGVTSAPKKAAKSLMRHQTSAAFWPLKKWAGTQASKKQLAKDLAAGDISKKHYDMLKKGLAKQEQQQLKDLDFLKEQKFQEFGGKEGARKASEYTSKVREQMEHSWDTYMADSPLGKLVDEISEKEKIPFYLTQKKEVPGLGEYVSNQISFMPKGNLGTTSDTVRHELGHHLIQVLKKGAEGKDKKLAARANDALNTLLETGETQTLTGGYRLPGKGSALSAEMTEAGEWGDYQAKRTIGEVKERGGERGPKPHRTFKSTGDQFSLPHEESTADMIEALGTLRGQSEISPLEWTSLKKLIERFK